MKNPCLSGKNKDLEITYLTLQLLVISCLNIFCLSATKFQLGFVISNLLLRHANCSLVQHNCMAAKIFTLNALNNCKQLHNLKFIYAV